MALMTIGEFARESRLSPKALRLYDDLGVLVPAHIDPATGYRRYEPSQLAAARLVASLRQLAMPLAQVRVVVALPGDQAARFIEDYWAQAELEHRAGGELARYLVDTLKGKRYAMPDVTTEMIPERRVLCLKRHVDDHQAVWDLGKEFVGILKERPMPNVEGVPNGMFLIYHGEVNAESDGPVEMCRPVPSDRATQIAADYPELDLRTEPAHEEASVHLGQGADIPPARWQVASDALRRWAEVQGRGPSSLGTRLRYRFPESGVASDGPEISIAVPLA